MKYNDRYFDNRLTLDAAIFGESRNYTFKGINAFSRDGLFLNKFWNVSASEGKSGGSSELYHHQARSAYGTATLGFDDTYYLDANLRNDWTSTLHPDNNSYLVAP